MHKSKLFDELLLLVLWFDFDVLDLFADAGVFSLLSVLFYSCSRASVTLSPLLLADVFSTGSFGLPSLPEIVLAVASGFEKYL